MRNQKRSEYVHTETYIAVCRVLLRELGCRATSAVERSAAGRQSENSWAEFNARSARYSTSGHRNASGQSGYTARRDSDAARANGNSSRPSESEFTRILVAKWNSESNRAGIQLTCDSNPWDANAARDRKSQHSE